MATGMARGAAERGKRIAFGNRRKILWGPHSKEIFTNNPNIAPPGHERAHDLEWIRYFKGHRLYNRQRGDFWEWNYDFKPKPGEFFFSAHELRVGHTIEPGFVLIEPNLPPNKPATVNKFWPYDRYEALAREFTAAGYRVVQVIYDGAKHRLANAVAVRTRTFREGMAVLARARIAIVPEGGMHHGAAALSIPAVVLFGGYVPPQVTGYDTHVNLTGNAERACGSLKPCEHCRSAMDSIKVGDVLTAADGLLARG